ncbi:hypothetical protein ACIBSR_06150 [Streptomyces sp. NPDC049936]|uniref:hypothetical protein n=1 Tax=Streptomyces sp. NPDC049936 TaxID=3365599 RepID=UPI0037B4A182
MEPSGFRTAYGLASTGAARPDGYIAWRTVTAPADPTQAPDAALNATAAPAHTIGTTATES